MSITPTDLIKYFKFHCYGNPDADTDIECPQHRSAKVPLVCDGVDAELLMEPLECTKTIFCQSRFCLATMQPKVMEIIGSIMPCIGKKHGCSLHKYCSYVEK
jgi:hypothetical protein